MLKRLTASLVVEIVEVVVVVVAVLLLLVVLVAVVVVIHQHPEKTLLSAPNNLSGWLKPCCRR